MNAVCQCEVCVDIRINQLGSMEKAIRQTQYEPSSDADQPVNPHADHVIHYLYITYTLLFEASFILRKNFDKTEEVDRLKRNSVYID